MRFTARPRMGGRRAAGRIFGCVLDEALTSCLLSYCTFDNCTELCHDKRTRFTCRRFFQASYAAVCGVLPTQSPGRGNGR